MKTLSLLMRRNIKLFFKDKGMFFTALITPVILLVLYVSFLGNVYRDSFLLALPDVPIEEGVLDGLVGGQLVSSLLAVCCVTVAFCSNFLMVQDKASGVAKDLRISPVSPSLLSLGYYLSTLASTLMICYSATALCFAYLAVIGFYLSVVDLLFLLLDVFLLVMFGTALASVVSFFLSSQGQISAVGTVVSSGYGFICGAYMPISSFGEGLQCVLSFLPGTYATSLMRRHAMQGALAELEGQGVPEEVLSGLADATDCQIYFFGERVSTGAAYLFLSLSVLVLIGTYILIHALSANRKTRKTRA